MPTVVSYLRSNALRRHDDGTRGEGEVFNTHTKAWEEPDVVEKEQLQGYRIGDTATPYATADQRSIRLGRALDANVMRELGALLYGAQPLPFHLVGIPPHPAGLPPFASRGGGHLASCIRGSSLCRTPAYHGSTPHPSFSVHQWSC